MEDQTDQQGISVLIVDDEPKNIQLLANVLREEGCAIEFATNGEMTLNWLKSQQFDLILLDVMMPGMDGYEVCGKIKSNPATREIPIIFLTAKTDSEAIVRGFEVGAVDYISKPFNKIELLARVRTHLNISSLQKKLQRNNEELEQRVKERTLELSQINTAYKRFVPHEFLCLLDKESILDVHLGDQVQKHMSVLFSDIRSFTKLSEQMTPVEDFKFINSYLNKMGPLVRKHHGFIDKFIGDAIMALFNGTADDALQAAIDMFRRLEQYNEEPSHPQVKIGIGINTGNMILGTIGEDDRMEGTVISDAVNFASRLEELTKQYQTPLLISEYTLQHLKNPKQYSIRFIDRVTARGKTEAISIYEVFDLDPPELKAKKHQTTQIYEAAWRLYQKKEFQAAESLFQECLQENHKDTAAHFFNRWCRQLKLISHKIDLSFGSSLWEK